MTVSELIKFLQQLPEDLQVVVVNEVGRAVPDFTQVRVSKFTFDKSNFVEDEKGDTEFLVVE